MKYMRINCFKKISFSAGILILLVLPRFCFAATLTPASVIASINQERQRSNAPELITDQRLTQAAKDKLSDMAASHYIDHANPAGDMSWDWLDAAGYPYRAAGENIGQDFFNTTSLMNAWMASDTHRANITSNTFKDIGAAIGTVDGHTVVTVMFGTTSLEPRVAGISTDSAAGNQQNSIPAITPPDQVATIIIPNTAAEQNVTDSLAKSIGIQPLFTSIYLFFSIFTAFTILTVFWRTS